MTTKPATTMTTVQKRLLTAVAPKTWTFLSADEVERADAHIFGYEHVCQHPNEIGVLGEEDALVVDFNAVQFGDTDLAMKVALAAARRGVPVGVHAYHLPLATFGDLLDEPLVVSAQTHAALLPKLQRLIAARRTVTLDS